MARLLRNLFAVAALACAATPAVAAPIVINDTLQGWYTQQYGGLGAAGSAGNTMLGAHIGYEYRSVYRFDLSSLAGQTVSGATLYIDVRGVNGGPQTLTLHDYTGPTAGLGNATGWMANNIWTDLGDGVTYGSTTISSAQAGTMVAVTLDAAAIAAINLLNGGMFTFGATLSFDGLGTEQSVYNTDYVHSTLNVDVGDAAVPEPASLVAFGSALVALGVVRRRRQR